MAFVEAYYGRPLVLIALLGSLLLLLNSLLNLADFQKAAESRAQLDLKSRVSDLSSRVSRWQSEQINSLIVLAEQRALREGAARLGNDRDASDWSRGFLQGCDAALRARMVSQSGWQNLTLREVRGLKLAGSGAQLDSSAVFFPDLQQRFRHQSFSAMDGRPIDRWVVPVRDAQAQPVAFLVADISPLGAKKEVLGTNAAASELICLDDTLSGRLWDSSDFLRIPELESASDHFNLPEQEYLCARAPVAGTRWVLTVACNLETATVDAGRRRWRAGVYLASSILLLWLTLMMLRKTQWTKTPPKQ